MSIPVIFAADDRFAVGAGVLMLSILENVSQPLSFYLLHDSLTEENRERLHQVASRFDTCELNLIDVSKVLADYPQPDRNHVYSRMVYARLMAPEMIDADRAVYLDSDTLVRHDLAELYAWDLQGAPLAAVSDYGAYRLAGRSPIQESYFRETVGGGPITRYFNSGVMVIDLQRFRNDRIGAQTLQLIQTGRKFRYADQCALNLVVQGDYAALPERWNAMTELLDMPEDPGIDPDLAERVREARRNPALIHYVGPKPWTPLNTRYKDEYQAVLRRSPWHPYRFDWSTLTWVQKKTMLNAMRSDLFSLRVRRDKVHLRLFGRDAIHWRRPHDQAA